jgi:methylated-DNA-[protein]-cysteine S-methyltransferase
MLDYIRKIADGIQAGMNKFKGKDTVFFGMIPDTLLGNVWMAAGKDSLVAIDFDLDESEFIQQTEKLSGARLIPSDEAIKEIATQLLSYLEGKSKEINFPVDLSTVSRFQREVLQAVSKVKRGQIITYGEIARIVGKPKASQAVGQALRWNPVPIFIPCHRVVNADGTLGGYGGRMGIERKIKLLKLEGAILA